jgi:hypothetical protein
VTAFPQEFKSSGDFAQETKEIRSLLSETS